MFPLGWGGGFTPTDPDSKNILGILVLIVGGVGFIALLFWLGSQASSSFH